MHDFFIFQIWIIDEIIESHNVSEIGPIFSALSKSACGRHSPPLCAALVGGYIHFLSYALIGNHALVHNTICHFITSVFWKVKVTCTCISNHSKKGKQTWFFQHCIPEKGHILEQWQYKCVNIGLSTHPGTGVDGASGRGWKLADFLLKHV